jgi:hypothetical protein
MNWTGLVLIILGVLCYFKLDSLLDSSRAIEDALEVLRMHVSSIESSVEEQTPNLD